MSSVEPCLKLLAAKWAQLQRNGQEIWLNADVIPGPNSRHGVVPVPAHRFVPLCRRLCPFARLSLGWRVAPLGSEEAYTTNDAHAMERLVHEHAIDGADLIFAAAIRVAEMSPEPLIALMQRVPQSELLLWTGSSLFGSSLLGSRLPVSLLVSEWAFGDVRALPGLSGTESSLDGDSPILIEHG